MRVLVTGAGGFVGRRSLAPLQAAGAQVHAVLSPRSACVDRVPSGGTSGETLHRADLMDPAAVDALIDAVRPTHLLHLAWIATPGEYWKSPENHRWLAASKHLLGAFHRGGGTRAVMAGSCAEYDWGRAGVCHERTTPLADDAGSSPATPYAMCKIALSRALEEFGRAHGLSTAWGRIFFLFGPGEDPRRLVPSVIVNLLRGREAPCTPGTQIRSFLHVDDVAGAFAALLGGRVEGPVNIGAGQRISIADLLERIARQIGRPELLRLGARSVPPSEPPLLVPDLARLSEEVGFRPARTLEEGLADTILWWRHALREGAGGETAPR